MLRIVLLLAGASLTGCVEPPAPEFLSREHKFKARFGQTPTLLENVGRTKSTVYSVEEPAGVFRVTITRLPIPDDDPPERVPVYLRSAQDDLIHAAGGTLISERSVTLAGKYAGREFSARIDGAEPGVLRVRLFLAGKRLYQVTAAGREEFANAPAATAFLDSFMVLE